MKPVSLEQEARTRPIKVGRGELHGAGEVLWMVLDTNEVWVVWGEEMDKQDNHYGYSVVPLSIYDIACVATPVVIWITDTCRHVLSEIQVPQLSTLLSKPCHDTQWVDNSPERLASTLPSFGGHWRSSHVTYVDSKHNFRRCHVQISSRF